MPPKVLCRNHLLGEHAEIHAVWSVITRRKKGYRCHPEVNRWRGKLKALYQRHQKTAKELKKRSYQHQSPLQMSLAKGAFRQEVLIDSLADQKKILKDKKCGCFLLPKVIRSF